MPSEFELDLPQCKRSLLTVCVIREGHLEKLWLGGGGGPKINICIYFVRERFMRLENYPPQAPPPPPPHFSHGSCLIDSFSLRKLTYARKLLFVWKKVLESFMKKENKHRTITREVFVLTSDANLRIHQPEKTTENSRRRHWFTFQREMKCHFAGKPLVASRSVGCFLGLIDLLSLYVLFSQWTSPGS